MPVSADMAFASVRTLGKKLRAREFTAVELAEFFLSRVETIGRKLNAVATVVRQGALDEAARADRELAAGQDRGPLHGIPYGAKDLLATRGIPTSWGAEPYRNRVLDQDATVIERLRNAGAVLIAKLAMIEIAGGLGYRQANASFTGPCLNPWNMESWAGGSSSGSGAAVGAGVVPFAIGSETWGSIMTPAGYCGVTGFRPTYGRVSRHGAMALSWTMDKLGPLCQTADDCGLVLNAIAGADDRDDTASDRPYAYDPAQLPKPPFKFAVLRETERRGQPAVETNFGASLAILKSLGSVEEVELPDLPYGTAASTIIAAEMSAAFEGLITSGECWAMTAPEDRVGVHAALFISARDYINAFRIRARVQRQLDELLARFDAIVTPTLPTVAVPLASDFAEYQRGLRGSQIGGASNLAGVPGITIPNGVGERNLPTGLQLVARAFEENRLLAIADAYQKVTVWHNRHPQL